MNPNTVWVARRLGVDDVAPDGCDLSQFVQRPRFARFWGFASEAMSARTARARCCSLGASETDTVTRLPSADRTKCLKRVACVRAAFFLISASCQQSGT